MKIGVFGTGTVGDTIGSKLVSLGHQVMMGSRTRDNEKAAAFIAKNGSHALSGNFADTAAFGEILVNCTRGDGTLAALEMAGVQNLAGKILIDIANPLDFSKGIPPLLSICNDFSLAEQVQQTYPELKVVKALNTMWCGIMVNPGMIGLGDHHTFMSGNDPEAKIQVRQLLESFGWKPENVLDLGDISTARGTEMYLPLWLRIWGATKNGAFNIRIVQL